MPKKNSSWSLQTFGKSVPDYEKKMQLPQEPLNKRPRGLARKSMAVKNFAELCGAATVNSSYEGKRETNCEHMAWY